MKKGFKIACLSIFVFIALISNSCKKKCDLGNDVTLGEIKANISIFPESGYLTSELTSDQYLITANHPYANRFKISDDQGITKKDVNFNEYSILCYPMTVSCFAQFTRDIKIDDINGVVKYTVHVKDCGKCEEDRYVENYVVIRAIPDTYTILYDVDIQTFE